NRKAAVRDTPRVDAMKQQAVVAGVHRYTQDQRRPIAQRAQDGVGEIAGENTVKFAQAKGVVVLGEQGRGKDELRRVSAVEAEQDDLLLRIERCRRRIELLPVSMSFAAEHHDTMFTGLDDIEGALRLLLGKRMLEQREAQQRSVYARADDARK